MDRSWWRMFLAVTTPPTNDLDTRRSGRAALVATGVLASGLLLAHGLREGEGDVVAIAVAAALIVVLVLARAGWPVVDRTRAQEAAQRLAAIVQSSSDAIYSLAADWTVTSWNAAAERLLGRPAAEMLGQPIASVWPPEQLEVNRSMFERALAGEVITEVETVRLHRDGTRVAVTVSWSPIKDNAGAFTGVSVIARDITHRRQLEEQLVRQALHDPLTGLANRALFTDRLEHALARGRGPGVTVAILVIDLDGFKDINDSLGHDAGDDLLTIAGMRLQGHARPGDTMARLGGDEFGVLLEDITAAEAVRSAQALLEGLATPIVLRDRDLTPTASIGIAIAAGEDAETLLRNADTAMYAAKRQGKGRYARFEPAMHATIIERLDLAADLSRAVEKRQLHLCYEPQISLGSDRICSLEALVRWRHPSRGEVSPGEFNPLPEETGMILAIGRWGLWEACRQVKAWQERWPAPAPLTIAVNLSARQLQHPGIVDEVRASLAAVGLDPQSLVLEITETAIMEQLDAAITILTELRRLGVRLALDDFGTGYSSLSYLQRLPVDILKIDRSFVAGVAKSTEESALARGSSPSVRRSAWRRSPKASRQPNSWLPCASSAASSARATTSPGPSALQPLTPCSNATTPERIRPRQRPTNQRPDVRSSLPAAQPGIHANRW